MKFEIYDGEVPNAHALEDPVMDESILRKLVFTRKKRIGVDEQSGKDIVLIGTNQVRIGKSDFTLTPAAWIYEYGTGRWPMRNPFVGVMGERYEAMLCCVPELCQAYDFTGRTFDFLVRSTGQYSKLYALMLGDFRHEMDLKIWHPFDETRMISTTEFSRVFARTYAVNRIFVKSASTGKLEIYQSDPSEMDGWTNFVKRNNEGR